MLFVTNGEQTKTQRAFRQARENLIMFSHILSRPVQGECFEIIHRCQLDHPVRTLTNLTMTSPPPPDKLSILIFVSILFFQQISIFDFFSFNQIYSLCPHKYQIISIFTLSLSFDPVSLPGSTMLTLSFLSLPLPPHGTHPKLSISYIVSNLIIST